MFATASPTSVHAPHDPPRTLAIILNPVAGIHADHESHLRGILKEYGVDYEIYVTRDAEDAGRFAEEAKRRRVELVLACGGDGTVKEVAAALRDSDAVMSILPVGTANVMAVELGFPIGIELVLRALLAGNYDVRHVDMGVIDQNVFLLRSGIGFEAEVSVSTPREEKQRAGRLAYFTAALRKLKDLRRVEYRMTLDGKTVVARGITCMICNSTNIGLPNLKLSGASSVSDGLLDVIVIPSLRPADLLRTFGNVLTNAIPLASVRLRKTPDQWQAKTVTVEMRRKQQVDVDGEPFKRARRVTAQALPDAVRIAVPVMAQQA